MASLKISVRTIAKFFIEPAVFVDEVPDQAEESRIVFDADERHQEARFVVRFQLPVVRSDLL